MARNEEKALTLFSKWTTFKKDFHSSKWLGLWMININTYSSSHFINATCSLYIADTGRRPFLASECESVTEAEKWRRELIRDITKKISNIHNGNASDE